MNWTNGELREGIVHIVTRATAGFRERPAVRQLADVARDAPRQRLRAHEHVLHQRPRRDPDRQIGWRSLLANSRARPTSLSPASRSRTRSLDDPGKGAPPVDFCS
jgi:hypothetical protein